MNIRARFLNLPLRYKILSMFTLIFLLTTAAGGMSIHLLIEKTIEKNIENELRSATHGILDTVRTATSVSIKNHLRAVAEKNLEITAHFYALSQRGYLTEEEAKKKAETILLLQKIGHTGYIFCINSKGIVKVHPEKRLVNTDISDFEHIKKQTSLKQGYMEYEWRNPGEKAMRPKALYMICFEPWDWIISASSYRTEFGGLINVDDFRTGVENHRFGTTGYSYVIDTQGNLIIHPTLEGSNIYNSKDADGRMYIKELCTRKSGKIIYPWKNPGEKFPREKLVLFNYIPEYEWIVASSSYLNEFYRPLATIRAILVSTSLATLLVVLLLAFKISSLITVPISQLVRRFQQASAGNLSVRMENRARDEIGQLARFFNEFMDILESHKQELETRVKKRTLELENEVNTRKEAEAALRTHMLFLRTFLDTIPNPAFYKDSEGIYLGCNKAFCDQIIGLPPARIIGRSLFDLPEQIPNSLALKYSAMDRDLIESGGTQVYESQVLCKDGVTRYFQLSKAVFSNSDGQVAGLAGVMLDITEINSAKKKIRQQAEHIQAANIELSKLASTDSLTGLNNRRIFQEKLYTHAHLSGRNRSPLSLLMADIDHFKEYNDTYGHTEGDNVLRMVATLLKENARKSDVTARYGGEEFVIILPDTDAEGAVRMGNRFRKAFHGESWPGRRVTASFGAATATFQPHEEPVTEEQIVRFINEADKALYRSKKAGRDRVTHSCEV